MVVQINQIAPLIIECDTSSIIFDLASDAQFSKKAWLPMHISRFTVVRYLASDAHFKVYNPRHLASDAQKVWLPMHKLQDFGKSTPYDLFLFFL